LTFAHLCTSSIIICLPNTISILALDNRRLIIQGDNIVFFKYENVIIAGLDTELLEVGS